MKKQAGMEAKGGRMKTDGRREAQRSEKLM